MIPGPRTIELVPDFKRMTSATRRKDVFIARAASHRVPIIFQVNRESRACGINLGYELGLGSFLGYRPIFVNFAKDTLLVRSPLAIACLYGGYLANLRFYDLDFHATAYMSIQKLALGCPIADQIIFRFVNLRTLTLISPDPTESDFVENQFRMKDEAIRKCSVEAGYPEFGYCTVPAVHLFPTYNEFTSEMDRLIELNEY